LTTVLGFAPKERDDDDDDEKGPASFEGAESNGDAPDTT